MENSFIDYQSISNIIQKLSMYKSQELMYIGELETCFDDINQNSKFTYSSKIDDIEFELLNKLKVLKKIHDNNTAMVNKTITKYTEAETKTESLFNDIYKG